MGSTISSGMKVIKLHYPNPRILISCHFDTVFIYIHLFTALLLYFSFLQNVTPCKGVDETALLEFNCISMCALLTLDAQYEQYGWKITHAEGATRGTR